ncbi:2-C-methyl-D-erythritol 4-phosphate cytidylyltransferase [Alteromonas sp. ASW11-36]|uniref:2-C-methyl-D-erythritol 4-phosphate cytidylyltransferase n=1 Tax=Alteromonas arenosi TaxID=3055817 RepID=A0ABT7SZQ0_9ALTE|nr:2-C-methyl-D-erythritol 4-phosphate cytidylyltransferase [Alteromonas sp. ASW11-36]MDM7861667.1 2-C-methyl-D-erythritol 4-phosphate cytidylyltransferase [Alteromonas sp. ASW11-36]
MNELLPVVIPAAGVGKRMQADRPKQYLSLGGKTLLEQTLAQIAKHPSIGEIILVISPEDEYFGSLKTLDASRVTRVDGGTERVNSVLCGLQALTNKGYQADQWVLVHDAARPCITTADIESLLAIREQAYAGGILAFPVRDTMKQARHNSGPSIDTTVPRELLWHALTPQMFRLGELTQAIEQGLADGHPITDEASAMEHMGHNVKLVNGSPTNIKVTTPSDLDLAAFYLTAMQAVSDKAHNED